MRSRRLIRLLRHIVEATLTGQRRELSEMAIGLSVFDRDPSTYNPAEDPIVRVQVRRLRDKLAAYYAADGRDDAWQIAVPCGSYRAVFRPAIPAGGRAMATVAGSDTAASNDAPDADFIPMLDRHAGQPCELIVAPLVSLDVEVRDRLFVDGVNEEIIGALSRAAHGDAAAKPVLRISARAGMTGQQTGRATPTHVLEGSIRRAGRLARASLRLSCAGDGRVVWAGQFDESIEDELAAQEALCAAVIRVIGTLRPLLA